MQRHFTVLATLAILLILAVGGSVYGLSRSAIQQSKQQAMQATAAGIAANVSAQTALLQQLVSTLAQSPSVVAAISSGDPAKLQETAEQLQRYIPGALKVRLILPELPDQANQTKTDMGFADLDMAKQSFINPPLPAVLELGNNQHLAIGAKTLKDNTVIGVILASLTVQPINESILTATLNDGYLRLMQGELPLLERGDATLKAAATQEVNIANTSWRIQYAPAPAIDPALQALLAAIVGVASLIAWLCFFKGYRNFETLFIGDRSMVLTAMKDLVNRRMHDTYPMNFKEMAFVVESLYSLNQTNKRQPQFQDNTEPYLFTEESDDFFVTKSEQQITTPDDIIEDTHRNANLSPINLVASANQSSLDAIFNPGVIRGIVDKSLNKEVFYNLGRAFGSELQTQAIHKTVLGYDGRLSSPAFAEAFAQGVIATGTDVLDIGLVPIPLVYFVAGQTEGKTAAMITGGHSPKHINGLKLLIQGELAHDKQLQTLKQRIVSEQYADLAAGNIEKTPHYNEEYLSKIALDVLLLKPLKVVLDCGNGAASLLAPKLLRALGCEVFELFCEVNGAFPHHLPDPSKPENMSDLMTAVVHYQADLGIAFDGDGDRLGLVDSGGKIIAADRLIQLFAKHILHTHPAAGIVFDDKCPKQLGDYITQLGGKPLLCKSGQASLQVKPSSNKLFAGEMSGRMIFNDRWLGLDDALYAAARVLEILSAEAGDSKAVFTALAAETPQSK